MYNFVAPNLTQSERSEIALLKRQLYTARVITPAMGTFLAFSVIVIFSTPVSNATVLSIFFGLMAVVTGAPYVRDLWVIPGEVRERSTELKELSDARAVYGSPEHQKWLKDDFWAWMDDQDLSLP
jgi:hypothetical protein